MIRFTILIAVLFAAVLGFEWLKDSPGELSLTVADRTYAVGLARAALALLVVVAVALVLVWLVLLILRSPRRAMRTWRESRERRLRSVLAQGLLSVASGELRAADRAAAEAVKRAPDAPLTRLLLAQVAEVRGDYTAAKSVFVSMLDEPKTRIAGLRGLHMESERAGNLDAARHYAQTALRLAPSAAWAGRALVRSQVADGDWDGALATLEVSKANKAYDRAVIARHQAIVKTAYALTVEMSDPQKARSLALDAHSLAPDLAPAAVVAGRVLARLGEVRRASKVLEAGWKAAPHPEIAEAYAHVRTGDSARDRLKRIQALIRMRPRADEGRLALVRAAIDSRDWDLARETLTGVIRTRPTRAAMVLMSEIEEAEHGDLGRAREWLARAVHAPADPVWIADGMMLEEWAPASPATGQIDAVEWRAPADRLAGYEAIALDEDQPRTPALKQKADVGTERPMAETEAAAPSLAAISLESAGESAEPEQPDQKAIAEDTLAASHEAEPPVAVAVSELQRDELAVKSPSDGESTETRPEPESPDLSGPAEDGASATAAQSDVAEGDSSAADEPAAETSGETSRTDENTGQEGPEPLDPLAMPRPDDPGVEDPQQANDEKRRFRLF